MHRNIPLPSPSWGCRVNGPGETDDADLGLWCGPKYVNLKKGTEELGAFNYDEILSQLKTELDLLISGSKGKPRTVCLIQRTLFKNLAGCIILPAPNRNYAANLN